MQQLQDHADDRLLNGCVFCGGNADTRDHVPSRGLLDPPYPDNLPVVGACKKCNEGFSEDEQYLICLLEVTLSGSTDPENIHRPSVARALKRDSSLRTKFEASKRTIGNRTLFETEKHRIEKVLMKLARGHAAFELSKPCRDKPDYFWHSPLELLTKEELESFNSPHFPNLFAEVGSRNLQRMVISQVTLESTEGARQSIGVFLNEWIEVQEGFYRYLCIDDSDGITIRFVIREYLACEAKWTQNA